MTTSRREFLGAAGAVLTAAHRGAAADAERPNILWIIAEDFAPNLGCYGDPDVATPNIDRLAEQGVLYTQATVTAPVCSAARSALATGMYQTSINAHNHRSHREDDYTLPEPVVVFTDYLRDVGYHTSNLENTPVGGRGKRDFNFTPKVEPFDGTDWTQRDGDQPFYAQINFHETHRVFYGDEQRPIDPATVHLPPYYPDHPVVRKDYALYLEAAQNLDEKVGAVLDRLEEQGLAEETIVFFFSDHGAALPRGKQFLYEEGIRIPLIVRIPEKFRPAGFEPGTRSDQLISHIDITATTLELAGVEPPDYMQARVFIGPDADPPRERQFAARDRCDETVDRIRAVRDREYKYIRNFLPDRPYTQPNHYKDTQYPILQVLRQLNAAGKLTPEAALFMRNERPEEELYDLQADPHELENLAGSAEHEDVLERMRGELEAWIERTDDHGRVFENPLPDEYETRTEVDGWVTSSAVLRDDPGKLHIELRGRKAEVSRPWVVEGGEMALELRARSDDDAPNALVWATVDNLRGEGNRVEIPLEADGEWREARVPFTVEGWLTRFIIELGPGEGAADLDWVKLYRKQNGEMALVREWGFDS